MKSRFLITFVFALGFVGTAFALDDKALYQTLMTLEEHYEIEVVGLKDKYVLGEKYSFSFVISGYGHECAAYEVRYPDENGRIIGMDAEPLCDPNMPLHEFEINYSDRKGTLGNVAIKNPGIYVITITFDKPNKYFPTTISKEFHIVESVMDDSAMLSPLKQFKLGISIEEVQCRESRVLLINHNELPACVKPVTKQHLIERGWGIITPLEKIIKDTGLVM